MTDKPVSWGRADQASSLTILITLGILVSVPTLNFVLNAACHDFGCSLTSAFREFSFFSFSSFSSLLPRDKTALVNAAGIYIGWYFVQFCLYAFLPGPVAEGHTTPAGHRLAYVCNGWRAWLVTHALVFPICFFFFSSATFIYDYRTELLWVATLTGFLTSLIFWVKAHLAPTHARDRKFSNSRIYDLYLGIELNPRSGGFDWKLFYNTRIGIIAWTLINLSYAAAQYRDHGFVSNSMILVNLLQAVYSIDLFWNEAWYLRTIDIEHDHFGFMLAYGDTAWLPFFYTLQGLYLVQHPIQLSTTAAGAILLLGTVGYYIFRSANNEKYLFRLDRTSKQEFILAPYTTADGQQHEGRLLCSGWWGMARHINYVGDLAMAYSWSLTCGFSHLLPWSYALFLTILLLHRTQRDKKRCAGKYGPAWNAYCQRVPYLFIPGVY